MGALGMQVEDKIHIAIRDYVMTYGGRYPKLIVASQDFFEKRCAELSSISTLSVEEIKSGKCIYRGMELLYSPQLSDDEFRLG
jgi:hypothetical protein